MNKNSKFKALIFLNFFFVFACLNSFSAEPTKSLDLKSLSDSVDIALDLPLSKKLSEKELEDRIQLYSRLIKKINDTKTNFQPYPKIIDSLITKLQGRIYCAKNIEHCPPRKKISEECGEYNWKFFETMLTDAQESVKAIKSEESQSKQDNLKKLFGKYFSQAITCAFSVDTLLDKIASIFVANMSDYSLVHTLVQSDSNGVKSSKLASELLKNISKKLEEGNITEAQLEVLLESMVLVDGANAKVTAHQIVAAIKKGKDEPVFLEILTDLLRKEDLAILKSLITSSDLLEKMFNTSSDEIDRRLNILAEAYLKENDSIPLSELDKKAIKHRVIALQDHRQNRDYPVIGIVQTERLGNQQILNSSKITNDITQKLELKLSEMFYLKELINIQKDSEKLALLRGTIEDNSKPIPKHITSEWSKLTSAHASFYIYMPFIVKQDSIDMYLKLVDADSGLILGHTKHTFPLFAMGDQLKNEINQILIDFRQQLLSYQLQSALYKLAGSSKYYGSLSLPHPSQPWQIDHPSNDKEILLTKISAIKLSKVFDPKNLKVDSNNADFIQQLSHHLTNYYRGFLATKDVDFSSNEVLEIEGEISPKDTSLLKINLLIEGDVILVLSFPIFSSDTSQQLEQYIRLNCNLVSSTIDILLYNAINFKNWLGKKDSIKKSSLEDTSIASYKTLDSTNRDYKYPLPKHPLSYIPWAFLPAGVPHLVVGWGKKEKRKYLGYGLGLLAGELGSIFGLYMWLQYDQAKGNEEIIVTQGRYNWRLLQGILCGGIIGVFHGISVVTLAALDVKEENLKLSYSNKQQGIILEPTLSIFPNEIKVGLVTNF